MNNKNFWTMKRGQAGFTLVELIVVIAILAILGGVAVPAYSGYVKKAEYSADEALLREVNTAFAAACAINGENHVNSSLNPSLTLSAEKTAVFSCSDNDVQASFETFFELKTSEFKVMTGFKYNAGAGMFEDKDKETNKKTYTHNGKPFAVSNSDEAALQKSPFANMDAGKLVGDVDSVVDFAAEKLGTNELLANLVKSDEFKAVFEEMYPDGDLATATDKEKMSALVLYTAKNSQNLDTNEMYNTFLTNKGSMGYTTGGDNSVEGDTRDAAMIAMQYAVGMAWAEQKGIKYSSPDELFAKMSNDGNTGELDDNFNPIYEETFTDWLEDNEATAKDAMDGYKAAMNIIGSNSGSISGNDLVDSNGNYVGFGTYETLIKEVLGQN